MRVLLAGQIGEYLNLKFGAQPGGVAVGNGNL